MSGPNSKLIIIRSDQDRALVRALISRLPEERAWKVLISPYLPKRSLPQNALLHSVISDVADQVPWAGQLRDVETWKLLFSAALYGQEVIPSLDGTGIVVRTTPTSGMNRGECSDLIESIYAFGAERGVIWTLQNG